MDYYNEALSRDPGDIRTNIAVGNFHLTNGNYALARKYFATALKRLARDYTRPSDCEAFYLQGLTLAALRLTEEATDTLYRATWDYAWHSAAFLELARISSGKGDYARALDQIEESLSTNSRNNRAVAMKASYQRRLGDQKSALKTIGDLYLSDPLDFRIANEVYLINRESGNEAEASFLLKRLTEKMRDYDQNYLELAVAYLNDGLAGEAEEVLLRFQGNNPIMGYYLGYIEDMKGNNAMAGDYFKRASEQPVDYTFPFRFETLRVLEKALEYNSSDSRAYYYMGNILYDKQPARAIECWEAAVRNDSSLAIAYRNLGWGYHRHYNDLPKAISFYEKAFSLDRNEAIWYTELDALYEVTNTTLDRRLALFENSNDVVRNRDDAFVRQITVLTMAGRPDRAVEFLEGKSFSYREGNSRVREVIIDAQLMLGKKYFEEKNYRKALEHFLQARVPDEEAGSARSGNRDIQVNYYIGLAYEALRNNAKARTYFRMAADQNMRRSGYMTYYQGLSLLKLGNNEKAEEIFTTMVAEGESQINRTAGGSDFFAIFGEREAAGSRNSMAYTIRGLGYKGLGDNARAEEDLRKAVELSYSNLWANAELNTR
jgi:tetratricopeptide (TPR) repeat protein